ncbi:branched-chain amino acid ABC transporter permease [Papillibacter cinnamivorans]|uniref:Branched-chain amino acid transport system permease protein n=1 Tax=Papillibacter cinnamivorans DSM 12816 TaxID=1122930 RepID=A0A1W1YWC5_9FIRM|nr:branched-chain amino acid ABC transporter permease [Papillibacter cinnamivorans]SMC40008.1 branched-chain amino acid transport system permease protein [Papillibacter cinnamivorans DSM 12816]
MSTFLQLFLRSLETGGIFALAALGIIIIYRTNNLIHFAQGTMGMFNTYVVTFFFTTVGAPLWLAVICGLVSATLSGAVVDFVIIRNAKKVTASGKEIITLGLIMIFLGITPMLFGVDPLSLPKFIPTGSVSFFGAAISYNGMLNIIIGLAIMGFLFYLLQKTKLGLAIRTTASNEYTARLMGVPTRSVTLFAWALAAILGCLAGVMIAPTTSVTLNLMDSVQVNAFIACVLGGFQTFYGPVLGAYIIGVLKNLLIYYVSSVWGEQILYLLIIVFIVFKPWGLIGKKTIKKV